MNRKVVPAAAMAGFSLIELVVTLGIIGLLTAILVPAVQAAREAARQITCLSNLKQIGLAVQNYESTYDVFPLWNHDDMQLLPFLEQAHLLLLPNDRFTAEARVAVYACPSDEFADGRFTDLAHKSYVPSLGIYGNDGFIRTGLGQVQPAEITDGLSATAAYSERLVFPQPYMDFSPPPNFPEHWNRHPRQTAIYQDQLDAYADVCAATTMPPTSAWVTRKEYNHILTPNQNSCHNGPTAVSLNATTASSRHPGGVHVLMADGSARFVSDSIGRSPWRAIGTRSGSETVSF